MRNAAESLMNERVSIWISWEGWGLVCGMQLMNVRQSISLFGSAGKDSGLTC